MKKVEAATFTFPGQTGFYAGKVRDVYFLGDRILVVASNRISAFDHILPAPIPYKGQVLNQLAGHFLTATRDIVPNWLEAIPDPNVSYGLRCEPIKIEMVIRGYLAGHAWREYKAGKRQLCGVSMPEGMREGDPFPEPIITPATKADEGHDEDISREAILERQIVPEEIYLQLEKYTRDLFAIGSRMARERGLILVDTKYEFGMHDGKVYLIDEVHTPDSSRYYILDGYTERQSRGERQQQLSKEFVREWLMENGFQGLEGQTMPVMPEAFVEKVSQRYIGLYEQLTGESFVPASQENIQERIWRNASGFLEQGTL